MYLTAIISAFQRSYFIVVFMLAYVLFRSRSLKLMPQGKWIAVGFLLMFLAVPFQGGPCGGSSRYCSDFDHASVSGFISDASSN